MQCVIMQPTYIPWLGYFDLIRNADAFIFYDNVQFEKQSWQQRNRIRNKAGELMLTVPVLHEKGLERKINEVRIDHSRGMLRKHLESVKHSYGKAINFKVLYPEIEALYNTEVDKLIELNVAFIKWGCSYLGIEKDFLFSSNIVFSGNRVEALIDLCQQVGADKYLSPVGSKAYIDENNIFDAHNIKLSYQQFTHPVYSQVNSTEFISHLSFIDYLFNVDLDEAKKFGSQKMQVNG